MTRWRSLAALLVALVLVAAGCGGDDGGGSDGEEESSTEPTEEQEEAPEGQVLVEEDFDDDENLWSPDDIDIPGQQEASVDDGTFTVEFTADAYETIPEDEGLVPNQAWPTVLQEVGDQLVDTRIEAEVEFESPGTAGLECRIADVSADSEDFRAYLFQVSSSGVANIVELDEEGQFEGVIAEAPELDEDEEIEELPVEGAVIDGPGSYELGLTCLDVEDGVEITGTIDGEEVLSGIDDEDPIESGLPGILSGQSRAATDIEGFEEFEVSFESATITNLGDEIDEDDLAEAREAAEEHAEGAEGEEPTDDTVVDEPVEPTGEVGVLGAPLDPSTVADYGSDATFDQLVDECHAGTFASCDQLFLESPAASGYEEYGATCGGRLEVGINGDCDDAAQFASQSGTTAAADLAEFGTDPALDELALACEAGDLEACDALWQQTPVGSEMELFGSTCGARGETEYAGNCIGDGS